jgi:hypothetical protein
MRSYREMVIVVTGFLWLAGAGLQAADSPYIYGLHDPGGEGHMGSNKGWITFTIEVGSDPNNYSGSDFSGYSAAGYGVICRLNNGYGSAGTIPFDSQYDNFAQRCANFVSATSGVDYYIIANEPNLPVEWAGNVNGDPNTGQPITSARYISCYTKCHTKIKTASPSAKVCPAASGTWAPPYPGQGIEGFLDYWVNCLNGIGASKIDGLILHAYTHGCDPALVTSTQKMGAPYQAINYHFQVYRNYMSAVPSTMRTKPVFITECNQNIECADGSNPHHIWYNVNNGWVRAIYSEINSWNNANSQKIRCVCLFRWPNDNIGGYNFGLQDMGNVVQDFQQAAAYGYRWSTSAPAAPTGLVATAGDSSVALSWNGSATATSYKVKRSTTSGGPYTVVASNVTTTSYADTTVSNSTTYYYVVSAVNANGESGNSSQVSATPTGQMNTSVPTGTNLSLSAAYYSVDSYYGAGFEGVKALDNSLSTKWCSNGNAPPHWIAMDLGASLTVNGFIVKHASAGGEGTNVNLKNFKFQSGSSLTGPWTDEATVDNSAQAGTTNRSYNTPKTLRYVRLYITNCGVDNYARLYEFGVYGIADSMNGNTPTGTNVATQSTQVTTDSIFGSGWEGTKAIDGVVSGTSKWCSNGNAPPHWIALDLGSTRTITGYIVRMAGAAGEGSSLNLKNFQIQTGTSITGPWTDEAAVDNTAQANVVTRSYATPKVLRYVRLYITNAGIDNYARLPEFQVYAQGGTSTVTEDFTSVPSWSSSYDASWGSAASWSAVAGGQSGNALQASRSSQGSSSKVKVYSVTANTNYTISVYVKCPSYSANAWWAECAYRLGSNTASDFDQNGAAWTMVKKFANDATNGNGNIWTQYTATFNSGSNTQISVGFKLGSSAGAAPTVLWDTLRVQ